MALLHGRNGAKDGLPNHVASGESEVEQFHYTVRLTDVTLLAALRDFKMNPKMMIMYSVWSNTWILSNRHLTRELATKHEDKYCRYTWFWEDPSCIPRLKGTVVIGKSTIARMTGQWETWLHPELHFPSRINPKKPAEDRIAEGFISKNFVEALVDTCAGNLISDKYLQLLGIPYDRTATRGVKRANGSVFSTVGSVTLPWIFKREKKPYQLEFDVVDHRFSSYPVVLGGKFMRATKTLSHFADRIRRKLRANKLPRVFLQGGSQLRMQGYCEGIQIAALPDTGSDVDLVSPELAEILKGRGLNVLTGPDYCIPLELPGGVRGWTIGVVQDADFRFGNGLAQDSYTQDFYILPGLPAEMLLSDRLLYEADAFQRYHAHLIELEDDESGETDDMFLNIKFFEQNPTLLNKVKAFFKRSKKRDSQQQSLGYEAHNAWCEQQINLLNQMETILQSKMTEEEKNAEVSRLEALHRRLLRKKTQGF